MSSQWGPTREPIGEPEHVDPQLWLRPSDVVAVVAAYRDGQTRPSLTQAAGLVAPIRTEPPPVDRTQERQIVESIQQAVDRLGPHPPLTPTEIAAHIHDLAGARGQGPVLNDDNRAEAEVAAAHLLAVLGLTARDGW